MRTGEKLLLATKHYATSQKARTYVRARFGTNHDRVSVLAAVKINGLALRRASNDLKDEKE